MYPGHRAMLAQPCCYGHGVLHMAVHAQRQRLQALQKQERVKGAETGAKVAHHFHAGLHDKGEIAKRFPVAHAMIAWRRLHHFWEGAIVPVEGPAIDNNATDTGAVPTDEFGGGMHDDTRAILTAPAQVG